MVSGGFANVVHCDYRTVFSVVHCTLFCCVVQVWGAVILLLNAYLIMVVVQTTMCPA